MEKIRVLHILQSNQFSGAENVVCQIIDMYKNSAQIEMAYCSPDGQIHEILQKKGVLFFPLSQLSVKNLRNVINQYQPKIIHAHDASASVIATLVNRKLHIVSHIHGNHLNMRKISVKAVLVKELSRYWSKIIWVSESAYRDYKFSKSVKNKSIILQNIILKEDLEKKLKSDESEYFFDCIVLGRINKIKNPLRALSIFEKVIKIIPTFKVAFVGNGDLLDRCIQYINEHHMEENIKFLGYMNNPIKVLAGSKLLVMTSIYEGTPICALEAMGMGVPIVSTPTDGILDLVLQDKTGFYSDDDNELAERIVSILSDKELYLTMKSATLRRFDQMMNVDLYKSKLSAVYDEALKG